MSTATLEPIVSYAPTKPVEVQPDLQQVTRGRCTICSIYPAKLHKIINHNGRTLYKMPAAPRGSYVLFTVYDTQQWIKSVDPMDGKEALMPAPITARIVAEDLVNTWAGDTLGARSGFRPGIGIIAGDEPTPQELEALREAQNSLFDWFIKDGHLKHRTAPHDVTDIHRLAAFEMLGEACESLDWYPKTTFDAVKRCPACEKQIKAGALRCEHCTTQLPQFYIDMAMEEEADPVVAKAILRIKARAASPVAPVATVVAPEPDTRAAGRPKG